MQLPINFGSIWGIYATPDQFLCSIARLYATPDQFLCSIARLYAITDQLAHRSRNY